MANGYGSYWGGLGNPKEISGSKISLWDKYVTEVKESLSGIQNKDYKIQAPGLGTLVENVAIGPLVGVKSGISFLKKLVKMRRQGVDMQSFFHNLDWNRGGKELWSKIQSLNPKILTGGKNLTDDAVSAGKRSWVRNNLDLSTDNVIVQTKKEVFASPSSVLIDDLPKNVQKFKKAGGNAILHTSEKKTIKQLNEMLKDNPNLQVYVDLDGVLVDLKGGVKKFKLRK